MPSLRHVLVLLALAWAVLPVVGLAQELSDAEVKAAFVFNFAKFVEWPAERLPAGQINLCTFGGREALLAAVAGLEGKVVQQRELRLRRLGNTADFAGCQILVVGEYDSRRLPDLLAALEGKATLTVGDSDGFVGAGGIIGMMVADQKVHFDINADSARKAGLKLSSQLLRLARTVKGKP